MSRSRGQLGPAELTPGALQRLASVSRLTSMPTTLPSSLPVIGCRLAKLNLSQWQASGWLRPGRRRSPMPCATPRSTTSSASTLSRAPACQLPLRKVAARQRVIDTRLAEIYIGVTSSFDSNSRFSCWTDGNRQPSCFMFGLDNLVFSGNSFPAGLRIRASGGSKDAIFGGCDYGGRKREMVQY